MTPTDMTVPTETWQIRVVAAKDPAARDAEQMLESQGFRIPLPSRVVWGDLLGGRLYQHALARAPNGKYAATLGYSLTSTRALPGHRVLRLEAVGDAYAAEAGRALISHAAIYAREIPRILRVVVELECRDDAARKAIQETLVEAGFAPAIAERAATRTLELDLSPDESALFAALSRSTRQNVRGASKQRLELRRVTDPTLATRMNNLLAESFARTGGRTSLVDWSAIMRLSAELPHRSNLLGAFRTNEEGTELVAFAWCMHHGDRAEYSHGASARIPGITLRLLTPVLWELILWAKREGAGWFDFGAITQGSTGSGDALGGISDFKRGFTKKEIVFAEEWVFEPNPVRARVARLASRMMERVRTFRSARNHRKSPRGTPSSPGGQSHGQERDGE